MSLQEKENSGIVCYCKQVADLNYALLMSFDRKTLRLAAALLRKVVDSLAPALTSMLVRSKEVTVVLVGHS